MYMSTVLCFMGSQIAYRLTQIADMTRDTAANASAVSHGKHAA